MQDNVLEVPNEVLQEIFEQRAVRDNNDEMLPLHSNISIVNANALYHAVLTLRPKIVVEIGMAYGISTLAIATALDQIGEGGDLISIDPNQHSGFSGIAVHNLKRSGLDTYSRLIEKPSYLALPQLLADGTQIDIGYIDGWHTFDYTLLDFFYLDKMLSVNGLIGFNDTPWAAVRKAMNFVKTHRKYEEQKIVKPDYYSHRPFVTLARRILRQSKSDRYFKKLADWEPNYDFFAPF